MWKVNNGMWKMSGVVWIGVMAAGSATAAAPEVRYAPPAQWVVPPMPTTATPAPTGAALRFLYSDTQVRVGPGGEERYFAYRVRLLKPEAMQLGNISIAWSPAAGGATIHRLDIIRDGIRIDVLKDTRFQVIQREGALEQSMLDGRLTAVLQIPGLRVGDELEFAATVRQRDPTLGDHAFGFTQLPLPESPGVFRFQLSWPDAAKLTWRATRDLPQPVPVKAGGRSTVTFELRDPAGAILNEGAPQRYNIRRQIEFSDFASWQDVARQVSPLFEKASLLPASSPLQAEAQKIAAASPDTRARILAALRLTEEQVRYVYVGLDGGNYRPATADETWQRRFGDCKAKTVLLLALLRELGVKAEAVLANPLADDGLDAHLPTPGAFNHVLVRTTVDGETLWLDGTRLGDRSLAALPSPTFLWVLPLRPDGAALEEVMPVAPKRPQLINVVDIDSGGGFAAPALVKAEQVMREDQAISTRTQLSAMSQQDADRALRQFWRGELDWVEADTVGWRYDEDRATLVLSIAGKGRPGWEGKDGDGRSLTIIGAGFYAPTVLKRSREQDQSAPWITDFPRYRCWATTIHLPPISPGMHWALSAGAVNQRLGGVAYWRTAGLSKGEVRTVMSRNTLVPEIGAVEAQALNAAIPGFNNKMSMVWEAAGTPASGSDAASSAMPFGDKLDWATDDTACAAPRPST